MVCMFFQFWFCVTGSHGPFEIQRESYIANRKSRTPELHVEFQLRFMGGNKGRHRNTISNPNSSPKLNCKPRNPRFSNYFLSYLKRKSYTFNSYAKINSQNPGAQDICDYFNWVFRKRSNPGFLHRCSFSSSENSYTRLLQKHPHPRSKVIVLSLKLKRNQCKSYSCPNLETQE